MARKITFTEVPSSKGWEPFLKGMAVKDPAIFKIVGNVVTNGRQAIKRYNKKIKTGKLEHENLRPKRILTTIYLQSREYHKS